MIPTELNPAWVDVNFRSVAPTIGKRCGLIKEAPAERNARFPCRAMGPEVKIDLLPESDWRGLVDAKEGRSNRDIIDGPKDQKSEGSCTGFAMDMTFETKFMRTYGVKHRIRCSPQSTYQTCGSSSGSGSTLSCNLIKARDVGYIPSDTPENRERFNGVVLKEVGWSQRSNPRPDGWQEVAKNFRVDEWAEINSMAAFATCLILDIPVLYGRNGHALCAIALVWRNGRWYVMYLNSWGDWGDEGYGYDVFSSRLLGYGCYVPISIVHPDISGFEVPAPKLVV